MENKYYTVIIQLKHDTLTAEPKYLHLKSIYSEDFMLSMLAELEREFPDRDLTLAEGLIGSTIPSHGRPVPIWSTHYWIEDTKFSVSVKTIKTVVVTKKMLL